MFDRCRAWRSLLTRRAEGELSPSQRALLEDHIDKCAACREAEAADEALQSCILMPPVSPTPESDRRLEDGVVSHLRSLPDLEAPGAGWRDRLRAYTSTLSFEFCLQLAGGGLTAAAVTAFVLVSALNPVSTPRNAQAFEMRELSAVDRNDPPVPLESLFQSPTPRAAMLWAAPGRAPQRSPVEQPGNSPVKVDHGRAHGTAPRRHSDRIHNVSVSTA